MEPERPIYSDRFTRLLRINALIDTHGAVPRLMWWLKVTSFLAVGVWALTLALACVGAVAAWYFSDSELALPLILNMAPRMLAFWFGLFGSILGLAVVVMPLAQRYDERNASK